MTNPVIIVKHQRGRQGPSRRALRRAVRPSRVKVGIRVAFFLALVSLLAGTVGMSLNRNLEKQEHLPSIGR